MLQKFSFQQMAPGQWIPTCKRMKLYPDLIRYTKVNSDHRLWCNSLNNKTQNKTEINHYYLELDNVSLDMTSKAEVKNKK